MTDISRIPTLGKIPLEKAVPEMLYQEMGKRDIAPILGDAMMLSLTTTRALIQQAMGALRAAGVREIAKPKPQDWVDIEQPTEPDNGDGPNV